MAKIDFEDQIRRNFEKKNSGSIETEARETRDVPQQGTISQERASGRKSPAARGESIDETNAQKKVVQERRTTISYPKDALKYCTMQAMSNGIVFAQLSRYINKLIVEDMKRNPDMVRLLGIDMKDMERKYIEGFYQNEIYREYGGREGEA